MTKPADVDAELVRIQPSGPSPARRKWLYAAVATGAAAAGLTLGLKNQQPLGNKESSPELWGLTFDGLHGSSLKMESLAGRPLLLNFWATWCPPCVEEFPLLDRFYQENSANGWQVLGLAVDNLAAVQTFLTRVPVRFPIALAGAAGISLSKTLGNDGGGLPFTAVFGSSRKMLHRKIGRLDLKDLTQWRVLR